MLCQKCIFLRGAVSAVSVPHAPGVQWIQKHAGVSSVRQAHAEKRLCMKNTDTVSAPAGSAYGIFADRSLRFAEQKVWPAAAFAEDSVTYPGGARADICYTAFTAEDPDGCEAVFVSCSYMRAGFRTAGIPVKADAADIGRIAVLWRPGMPVSEEMSGILTRLFPARADGFMCFAPENCRNAGAAVISGKCI